MSAIAEPATVVPDDRLAKRNALVLAVAQALAGGNNAVIVSTGGIVGVVLAPTPALATLPISDGRGMWGRCPWVGCGELSATCAADGTAVGCGPD